MRFKCKRIKDVIKSVNLYMVRAEKGEVAAVLAHTMRGHCASIRRGRANVRVNQRERKKEGENVRKKE